MVVRTMARKNKKLSRSTRECIIKWKKISDGEYNIFLECDGSDVDILIGSCTYNITNKKWRAHPDFEPHGMGLDGHHKYTEYYNEIEAGRALKKMWHSTKNYINYQNHLNNSIPSYDSDYELTDEDWERIISDFSLEGN